jgi:hypothetical protein
MLIFGVDIDVLTVVSAGVALLVVIVWILREWSWSSYFYKTQQVIRSLQESNDNLSLRLQIEEYSQPQCFDNAIGELTGANTTVRAFISNLASQLVHPVPAFFDLSGFFQMGFFTSIILSEYYLLHVPHLSHSNDNPMEQSIKRELQEYLLKKHPLTNIIVYSAVAFLSVLAWWNLLPRTTFLDIAFKTLLALAVSSPLAFVTHNLLRVKVRCAVLDACCAVFIYYGPCNRLSSYQYSCFRGI